MKYAFRFNRILYIIVFMILIGLTFLYVFDYEFMYKLIAILTALAGLFSIFIEFRRAKKLAEAQFVTNLNHDFNTTESIIRLYNKLEKYYRSGGDVDVFEGTEISDLVIYFTFFETLYTLIEKNIISISKIHDLFAYRFFIIVHNLQIQEKELKPYGFSYENIFSLYDKWFDHAIKLEYQKQKQQAKKRNEIYRKKSFDELNEFVVMKHNYLKDRVGDKYA